MKTLSNAPEKAEILRRLQSIQRDSQRRWGSMSAHQMICHLNDGFRLYMGERTAAPANTPLPRSLTKWFALWAPIRWPQGFKTAPELDQQIGGTRPAEFDLDMQKLRESIDRFTCRPRKYTWKPHPHFGAMSEAEWMRLAYLHTDHHLRQFGA